MIILALLFGPLAYFDRRLVLFGTVAFIPEALLFYVAASLGPQKSIAVTPLIFLYHALLAGAERWRDRLPAEMWEQSPLSRGASLALGFLIWIAVSSPLWWPIVHLYSQIANMQP